MIILKEFSVAYFISVIYYIPHRVQNPSIRAEPSAIAQQSNWVKVEYAPEVGGR